METEDISNITFTKKEIAIIEKLTPILCAIVQKQIQLFLNDYHEKINVKINEAIDEAIDAALTLERLKKYGS